MSGTIFKTFIYVQARSGRVLGSKVSRKANFFFDSGELTTHQVNSKIRFPRGLDFDYTYSPVAGLQKVPPPSAQDLAILNVLKRKIEILLVVRANIYLVRKNVQDSFGRRITDACPVKPEYFSIYWSVVREEKKLLLSRVQRFFRSFQARLEKVNSLAAVEAEYQNLIHNLNIGFFTAMHRERREEDGVA